MCLEAALSAYQTVDGEVDSKMTPMKAIAGALGSGGEKT
jgi:hypothetical protein